MLGLLFVLLLSDGKESQSDQAALDQAVAWIREAKQVEAQYDYEMTARIRVLFFWVTREDVGGGYIRRARSANDAQRETIALLFGSDPDKARGVNRWGAGTEVIKKSAANDNAVEASAFMGFMKASKGASVAEMQGELSNEKTSGKYLFEAIVTRVDQERAIARTSPFASDHDFTLKELERAEQVVLDRLADPARPVRRLEGPQSCGRTAGFLTTVQDLINQAIALSRKNPSLCYVYNARKYTATLKTVTRVERETLSANKAPVVYHNLVRARFQILNHQSGKTTDFDLLVPRDGPMRGIPVQIVHQPNFWFQVVLNLAKSS